MAEQRFPPVHPGRVLSEDYLPKFGLKPAEFATAMKIEYSQAASLLQGREPLTATIALRAAKLFDADAKAFLDLQAHYDLMTTAERQSKLLASIETMAPAVAGEGNPDAG